MPHQIAVDNGHSVLVLLRQHSLYPLQLSDLRELKGLTDSQKLRLLEYCLLEEATRLLQDVCRPRAHSEQATALLSEKLPLRSLPDYWLSIFERFRNECCGSIGFLEFWCDGWTEEQVALVPAEGIRAPSGMHFTNQISDMYWTEEKLDQWASAWDPELVRKICHRRGDPGLVLTHIETGLKILLSADPEFVVRIVRGLLAGLADPGLSTSDRKHNAPEAHPEAKILLGSLRYKSELKNAIVLALMGEPGLSDLALCGLLDEQATVDLPKGWKNGQSDRSFQSAYMNEKHRNKIESLISKVRRDMLDSGLLHSN